MKEVGAGAGAAPAPKPPTTTGGLGSGFNPFGPQTTTANRSGGSSGGGSRSSGGGGGGGGGGGSSGPTPKDRASLDDFYMAWYGRPATTAELNWAFDPKDPKTQDDLVRRAVSDGAKGPAAVKYWGDARQTVMDVFFDPKAIPDSQLTQVVTNLATGAWNADAAKRWVQQQSGWVNSPGYKLQASDFVDTWTALTGRALTFTASNMLTQFLQNPTYTLADWTNWVKGTDSANTGTFGFEKQRAIEKFVKQALGRSATEDELKRDGKFWLFIDPTSQDQASAWNYVRTDAKYKEVYNARFVGKPPDMDEATYIAKATAINAVMGQHYGTNKVVDANGDPITPTEKNDGTDPWEWSNTTPEEMKTLIGADPTELGRQLGVTQTAIENELENADVLKRTLGVEWTKDQWYQYTQGGADSGALRAELNKAKNLDAFRVEWRNYYNTDPTAADYKFVSENFVNPQEFANRKAAAETAKAKLPELNEVAQRVLGRTFSQSDLENWAMHGEGSGTTQALMDQASRLDQYRWMHKQYYGTEPTPEDYAKYAGYASPDQLQWEIATNEEVKSMGPEVQKIWQATYGAPLSDADLRTMVGKTEGYGAIEAQYKEAQKQYQKIETSHDAAFSAQKAQVGYQAGLTGGFGASMDTLPELQV